MPGFCLFLFLYFFLLLAFAFLFCSWGGWASSFIFRILLFFILLLRFTLLIFFLIAIFLTFFLCFFIFYFSFWFVFWFALFKNLPNDSIIFELFLTFSLLRYYFFLSLFRNNFGLATFLDNAILNHSSIIACRQVEFF